MMSTGFPLQRGEVSIVRPPYAEIEQVARVRPVGGRTRSRVLLANQQPIVRYGVRTLLASEPDLVLVAETDNGTEAVQLARRLRPDVLLIDLLMPATDGISVTRTIRAELPETQVIVMTGVEADAAAVEAIRAGAAAYLLKDTRIDVLLRAIRSAGAGQVTLPMDAAARLVRVAGRHEVLSERETEVLYLVARGLSNKQVARELGITESTVKTHVSGILAKLGLPSRTQAALYAARTGLVALDHLSADATVGTTAALASRRRQPATWR